MRKVRVFGRRGGIGRSRAVLGIGLLGIVGLAASGCGDRAPAPTRKSAELRSASAIGPGPRDVAVLDLGALGEIRIELLPEIAPETVAQFVKLAEEGFYDGTYFHRVIPGFMIQGGDPLTRDLDPRNDGKGNAGATIPDEFSDYAHVRGTVSMANTGFPRSASSQFFIVHQDTRDLDGHFAAFGRVVSGIEVVDAITELEIDAYGRYGPPNRPYPVSAAITRTRIERAGAGAVAAANPTR
jgi:peptidyl-prolyl cis-trans isomerase B (cyclophilin B)